MLDGDFRGHDFTGADLRNATFQGGSFAGAIFVDADLRGVRFNGGDFRNANFAGADLRGAHLAGTRCPRRFVGGGTRSATLDPCAPRTSAG